MDFFYIYLNFSQPLPLTNISHAAVNIFLHTWLKNWRKILRCRFYWQIWWFKMIYWKNEKYNTDYWQIWGVANIAVFPWGVSTPSDAISLPGLQITSSLFTHPIVIVLVIFIVIVIVMIPRFSNSMLSNDRCNSYSIFLPAILLLYIKCFSQQAHLLHNFNIITFSKTYKTYKMTAWTSGYDGKKNILANLCC